MHPPRPFRPALAALLLLLLLQATAALAFPSYLTTFSGTYPASDTDTNANCAVCHNSVNSGNGFNPYGDALRQQGGGIGDRILAVEGIDSDNDPTGSSNLVEINASAQPGWTGNAPNGVVGDLDPVVATEPNIAVAPLTLDFSTVTVGSSASRTTTVENTGDADLNVTSVTLGAGTSSEYSVAPNTAFSLAPGGSQALTITYQPLDAGTDVGSLEIASDDPDTPTVTVDFTGTGAAPAVPDINVVPGGVDFGTVTIGGNGTQTAQIQNVGDAALQIDSVGLCRGTSSEFSFDPLTALTIPAGGSTTLTVNYAPTNEGTDTGCLEIQSNDPDEATVEFTLAGTGTLAAAPDIALDPASLDFGALTVGDSASISALVRNAGSAPLTVSGIALSMTTSLEYTLSAPATPVTIPAGGSETVTVTYSPTDEGTDTGAVVVNSDDPDQPTVEIALSGSGNAAPLPPDINLDPASLGFGTVTIGRTESLASAVQNLGGEPLSVTMVNLCAGTSSEFGWSPSSFTVPPGSSVDLTVAYTPVDVGLEEGCLAIASNDPDEASVELGLSGTGQEPQGVADVQIQVPGAINPDSEGKTPVHFFADGADVVVTKVTCGRDDEHPKRLNIEDFNDDGFADTVALFETDDLEVECGDITLECSGMLEDGTDFHGISSEFRTVGRECRKEDDDDDDRDDDDGDKDDDRDDAGDKDEDRDDDGDKDEDRDDDGDKDDDRDDDGDKDDDRDEDGDREDRDDDRDQDSDRDDSSSNDDRSDAGDDDRSAGGGSAAGTGGDSASQVATEASDGSGGGCSPGGENSAPDPTLAGLLAAMVFGRSVRRRRDPAKQG